MMTIREALKRHQTVVDSVLENTILEIEKGAEILANIINTGHTLFTCGNGGSAADSQHLVAEFLCKYKNNRAPFKAITLTSNISTLTAISNDYGFEEVFVRQIRALGERGDCLVAFTTSGKSKNILRAINEAKKKGMTVIVMTGEGGESLKNMNSLVDLAIVVLSKETARIQEVHGLIIHTWCEYIDTIISTKSNVL